MVVLLVSLVLIDHAGLCMYVCMYAGHLIFLVSEPNCPTQQTVNREP